MRDDVANNISTMLTDIDMEKMWNIVRCSGASAQHEDAKTAEMFVAGCVLIALAMDVINEDADLLSRDVVIGMVSELIRTRPWRK